MPKLATMQTRSNDPTLMTVFIGVDPGISGGIAFSFPSKYGIGRGIEAFKMPDTVADMKELISKVLARIPEGEPFQAFATMERVQGYTGQSRTTGMQMFNFGQNAGRIEAVITMLGVPLELVQPNVWQKRLGIPSKTGKEKESKSLWKNKLKTYAQRIFPNVPNITLKNADALLILEYGIRKRLGAL